MITLIAAVDKNNVLAIDGKIPWHSAADLKRFKARTTGSVVFMGRKTFDSIGGPLPNRTNVVITRDFTKNFLGAITTTLEGALWNARQAKGEVFIIGGAEIYKAFIASADKIDLTVIPVESDPGFSTDIRHFPLISEQIFALDPAVEALPEGILVKTYRRK